MYNVTRTDYHIILNSHRYLWQLPISEMSTNSIIHHHHHHHIDLFKVASHQRLCSASRHQLPVLRHRLTTLGSQSFSIADPIVWTSIFVALRDPACNIDTFKQLLKTYHFPEY